MSVHMDEDEGICFIYQEDEDSKHSTMQLKDIEIGDSFFFMNKRFVKSSDLGWMLGVCNITDAEGNVSHIHPTTRISIVH